MDRIVRKNLWFSPILTTFFCSLLPAVSLLAQSNNAAAGAADSEQQTAINLEHLRGDGRLPPASVSFLEDPDQNLEIANVRAADRAGTFTVLQEPVPRLGVHSNSAFWLKLHLRNDSATSLDWLIKIQHGALYHLDIFTDTRDEPVFQGGDLFPFARRDLPHRFPAVRMQSQPGDQTVYIRLVTPAPQKIPLRVYRPDDFERTNTADLLWHGLFYGALAIMVIYNLLLYKTIGEREYLFLASCIFFVLLGYLKIDGIAFQYLWPDTPALNKIYNLIFCGGMISIALFFQRFLRLRHRAPPVYQAVRVLIGLCLLVVLTFPLQFYFDWLRIYIAVYLLLPSSVLVTIGSFFVGLYVWRRGNPAGLYNTVAIVTLAAIGNLSYFEWMNLIPSLGPVTDFGANIGFIAYVALLGFGTGQRIRTEIRSLQRLNANQPAPARGGATSSSADSADSADSPASVDIKSPAAPAKSATAAATNESATNESVPDESATGERESGADWTITPRTQEKLKLALEYLRENYLENVSREALAKQVDLNSDNLGRFFKIYTGEKMGDYVNRLRINEAARMLRETDEKIIDVAFAAGFESLKTFNRNFSAFQDMTPSEYRQRQNTTTAAEVEQ